MGAQLRAYGGLSVTRKVLINMYMTLDGIAALTDDPHQGPEASREFWEAVWSGPLKAVDTLLLGRRTYEMWAGFWPGHLDDADEHMRSFARFSTRAEKIVFSRRLKSAGWSNSRIVRGPLADEISRLRSLPGKNMAVGGGLRFVQSVLAQDLADDLYLAVSPSIVGRGRPLFRVKLDPHQEDVIPLGAPDRHDFRLLEARGLDSGIVLLHYALSPKTGSRDRATVKAG
jgi:dihydrofolate reductase